MSIFPVDPEIGEVVTAGSRAWVWTERDRWESAATALPEYVAVSTVNGESGAVTLTPAGLGAATAAQGAKADTAVQPAALDAVAATIPTTAADVGAVPTTRTINGLDLSANRTLAASDIGAATAAQGALADAAVPNTRTVNGNALSANVTLDATDVGADPTGTAASEVAALPEFTDGMGTSLDDGTAGFLSIDNAVLGSRANLLTVANTTTETSLLVSTISIPGATISTVASFEATTSITNNTGSPVTVTFRLKLGATTVATWAFTSIASSATGRTVDIRGHFAFFDFLGSTQISGSGVASPVGLTALPAALSGSVVPTAALNLTVQFSTNSPNLSSIIATMLVRPAVL